MRRPDLSTFPHLPGCYLFKDASGRILYAGKAADLRKRLASYFREDSALTAKTRAMLRQAVSIDTLTTGTEKEALLLEAGLIKKHRPRYNIVLRDDKDYLLYRINTRHPYPRLEVVRKPKKRLREPGALLFGPFSSGLAARETWKVIHKAFPLRRCADRAFKNRTRPCLYHYMGQCLAPCVLPVPKETYDELVRKVVLLLSGRSTELVDQLRADMRAASDSLNFETAAVLRDQLQAVERTVERQSVVLHAKTDLDLIGLAQTPGGLALGLLFVRQGMLTDGRNFFWPGLTLEDSPELLTSFLAQFYREGGTVMPGRIVLPWLPGGADSDTPEHDEARQGTEIAVLESLLSDFRGAPVRLSAPHGPDEDRLSLMAAANAREAAKTCGPAPLAEVLAARLNAPAPVRRIEAVDISHTGGSHTRAGMVVFEDERPVQSDFRTYRVDPGPDAAPGDDYAALAAWAARRAGAGEPWPDLVLVDGGKGQLAAVARAFEQAGVNGRFTLASIAKARDEEGRADRRAGNVSDAVYLVNRANPAPFAPGSAELLFLQRVRDAAHDFVLGRHRQARSKAALSGELTRLPGIGPKLARILYDRFGSLENMAGATEKEIGQTPGIGPKRAASLKDRLARLME